MMKLKDWIFGIVVVILFLLLMKQTNELHSVDKARDTAVTELANYRIEAGKELQKKTDIYRQNEQKLQADASDVRKETNEAIQTVGTHRDVILKRLRTAEANLATARLMSRTSSDSSNGTVASGDTGTGLLATIGAEDVDEATRAETIRLHLKACYARYDQVQVAMRPSQ